MYRDKKGRFVFIGQGCSLVEFDEFVGVAGIHHLHVLHVFGDQFPQFQGDGQGQRLFLGFPSDSARILSAMSCIDDNHIAAGLRLSLQLNRREEQPSEKGQQREFVKVS